MDIHTGSCCGKFPASQQESRRLDPSLCDGVSSLLTSSHLDVSSRLVRWLFFLYLGAVFYWTIFCECVIDILREFLNWAVPLIGII